MRRRSSRISPAGRRRRRRNRSIGRPRPPVPVDDTRETGVPTAEEATVSVERNTYLDQVVAQQGQLEQDLRSKRSVKSMAAPPAPGGGGGRRERAFDAPSPGPAP